MGKETQTKVPTMSSELTRERLNEIISDDFYSEMLRGLATALLAARNEVEKAQYIAEQEVLRTEQLEFELKAANKGERWLARHDSQYIDGKLVHPVYSSEVERERLTIAKKVTENE